MGAHCYTLGYPGAQLSSGITVYSDSVSTCVQVAAGSAGSWPSGWALFGNGLSSATPGLANVHLTGFTLDGNSQNIAGTSGANLAAFGFAFYGASNSSVENMVVMNGGDNGYVDCSGPGKTTHGKEFVIRNSRFTGAQRNNISYICGTDFYLYDSYLAGAVTFPPEEGIDVEPNVAGGGVDGIIRIGRTSADNNGGAGFGIGPNFDAGSLVVEMDGDEASGNGINRLDLATGDSSQSITPAETRS